MKMNLTNNQAVCIIEPSGPSDALCFSICRTDGPFDQTVASVSFTANEAACLISALRRAFTGFME